MKFLQCIQTFNTCPCELRIKRHFSITLQEQIQLYCCLLMALIDLDVNTEPVAPHTQLLDLGSAVLSSHTILIYQIVTAWWKNPPPYSWYSRSPVCRVFCLLYLSLCVLWTRRSSTWISTSVYVFFYRQADFFEIKKFGRGWNHELIGILSVCVQCLLQVHFYYSWRFVNGLIGFKATFCLWHPFTDKLYYNFFFFSFIVSRKATLAQSVPPDDVF